MVVFPTHLLLGTWERDRPPSESEREIRLQQLDLDALGLDEPHRITIRIPVNVGIVQLLPAVKLFGTHDNSNSGDFQYTSRYPSMSWAFQRSSILSKIS